MSRYALRSESNPRELMTDNLQFVFLELGRFDKGETELASELDRWCYALKSLQSLDKRPLSFQRDIFRRLFEAAELSCLPKEERTKYALQMDTKEDIRRQIEFAASEARQEGMEKGMEKGRLEGKAEGKGEGRIEALRQITANLRAMGLSEEQIARATALPGEE